MGNRGGKKKEERKMRKRGKKEMEKGKKNVEKGGGGKV